MLYVAVYYAGLLHVRLSDANRPKGYLLSLLIHIETIHGNKLKIPLPDNLQHLMPVVSRLK